MTDAKTCPTCGAPLPGDATGGACPKCLLQAGFATGSGSGVAPSAHVPTPEELAPKFPGLVIGEMLGRGGMGVVYRARHKALDREVALKVLPSNVAADRAFADRFQREARALAKLQHPNIVAVHDFGQTDDLFWLVMEFVDGANIRQAMRAGQIGPKEALAIVPQICDALQYAHEHGVVHRDIKPENVLLDKAGHVKVADFGLAKLMEHGPADHTLTGAGQVMGTPHYMAPEQWEKPTTVDHRADIYSLGVVFYEMLTGELPVGRFEAPSKRSDIDARIDEIVMRTLEREREARYQKVADVKTDVGRVTAAAPSADASAPRVAISGRGVTVESEKDGGTKRVQVDKHGVRVQRSGKDDVNVRWAWNSDAEKARGGKLSKLAVAGTLGVPLAIVVAVVASDSGAPNNATIIALAGPVLLGGWIASMVAWARIQHSGDALRGRVWAAIGTFLPAVACCTGAPLVYLIPVQPVEDAAPVDTVAIESDRPKQPKAANFQSVLEFWSKFKRRYPDADTDTLLGYYAPVEREVLRTMPIAERQRSARSLGLGLPMVPSDLFPDSVATFGIKSTMSSEESHAKLGSVTRWRIEVSSGEHFLRFSLLSGIKGDEQSIYFDVAPVEIE